LSDRDPCAGAGLYQVIVPEYFRNVTPRESG
jgi:hypothetical protein